MSVLVWLLHNWELGNIAGSGKVVEAIDFISGIGTAVNTIAFTPANAVTDMVMFRKIARI